MEAGLVPILPAWRLPPSLFQTVPAHLCPCRNGNHGPSPFLPCLTAAIGNDAALLPAMSCTSVCIVATVSTRLERMIKLCRIMFSCMCSITSQHHIVLSVHATPLNLKHSWSNSSLDARPLDKQHESNFCNNSEEGNNLMPHGAKPASLLRHESYRTCPAVHTDALLSGSYAVSKN